MAMKSLAELRALYKEPQLLNKWLVEVPTWPTAAVPANPDVLFMVTSSSVPEPEYENATVELGGYKMNHNGKTSRSGSGVTWTFFDNTDSDIIKYFFIDYANKRQDFSTDASVTMAASKSSELIAPIVVMSLLAQDGKTVTKQIKLLDVLFQPSGYGGDLGQEVAVLKPVVTLVYDSFVYLKV